MRSNLPLFLSSSVVERSAVNRLVVGSNPTWGDLIHSEALGLFPTSQLRIASTSTASLMQSSILPRGRNCRKILMTRRAFLLCY